MSGGLDHEILRHLADTWGLLLLVTVFLVAIGVALRPGARDYYRACANIPLEDDETREPRP